MMQLLVTSGIRQGECIGLKWKDIDERAGTITIERSAVYTTESGIIISTPKPPTAYGQFQSYKAP